MYDGQKQNRRAKKKLRGGGEKEGEQEGPLFISPPGSSQA